MDTTPLAGRREWLGLAVLALPTLLLALDLSVLYLALPTIARDLDASAVEQLWLTDVYGFMVAGFLVTMGTLGDRIGRRRLLLIGAAAFAVASVCAAFAPNPALLVVCRAALGLAGATLGPATLALISTLFRVPAQRAVAMAVWMSCFIGGNAVGPVVGGVLLAHFWWGAVFLLGVPVMVLLLVVGPAVLPEYRAPDPGRLDLPSVALSLLAILPAVYGLKELARHGFAAVPAAALVAGIGFGVAFVARQRRLATPLLDLRLFADRTFLGGVLLMLSGGVFLGGMTLLVSQYLQVVRGLPALTAGLLLVPAVVAMTVTSLAAPVLARRFRPGAVIAVGMAVGAAGYLVLTQAGPAALVGGWTVALAGAGLPAGLAIGLIVGAAPQEKAGAASAVAETSTELGLSLGIALLGSLATAVYLAALPPGSSAADGITAAPAAALAEARAAYTAGLTTAATVSAAVSVALVALAAVAFRRVPTYSR